MHAATMICSIILIVNVCVIVIQASRHLSHMLADHSLMSQNNLTIQGLVQD